MTPERPTRGRAPREVGDLLRSLQHLTPRRVRRLLLLANPYDQFLLEEDGQLHELILTEFLDANPSEAPWLTRFGTAAEALTALERNRPRFDCVVATTHARDMHVLDFAKRVKAMERGVPVIFLAFDARELEDVRNRGDLSSLERLYAWQGDHRILLGIVKSLEDRWNVRADTRRLGVGSIILVEDSVRYYSTFLPKLYEELLAQSKRVVGEGTNVAHKLLRMRARPKVLHATTHEEAVAFFQAYCDTTLGILSDVDYPRRGVKGTRSGLEFARRVREQTPDMPILLQTSDPALADEARKLGAQTLLKGSPTLLDQLSRFLRDRVGFGDFVFRNPDGSEAVRAADLRELESAIRAAPDDSILPLAEGNQFSRWLRARTEFGLADELKPRKTSEFSNAEAVREFLARAVRDYRIERQRGVVSDFDVRTFETETSFARIGGGSLGGKARGLALVRRILHEHGLRDRFPGVRIVCPSAVVLATDVFDRFMDENALRDVALGDSDDETVQKAFLGAKFDEHVLSQLRGYLDLARYPLAVRSSSLLEDAQRLPFAGVYRTFMIANADPDPEVRLADLVDAVKRVWASTYLQAVRDYVRGSPYRLEEEKMAVVIQRVTGVRRRSRFYPDFAGVARSHDFYPTPPNRPQDGVVCIAPGFGQSLVEGGRSVRFCPQNPMSAVSSSPEQLMVASPTEFYALDFDAPRPPGAEPRLTQVGIETAASDGALDAIASTWSREDNRLRDGLRRGGVPVVTFAPVLRQGSVPIAGILAALLEIGCRTLDLPVEYEFAVNLDAPKGAPVEFAILQMRPFDLDSDLETVTLPEPGDPQVFLSCDRALGNGRFGEILDVVFVRRAGFERKNTRAVATVVASMNSRLIDAGRPYLLIGVGRWGSADPWLGIPVTWEQIRGARVIVESGFEDLDVVPSQGSHFFHNLTAARAAYLTVGTAGATGALDWAWLESLPYDEEAYGVRHVRLEKPVSALVDGRTGRAAVMRGE